jgi:carboxyl-terminal processing protease
MLAFNMHQRRRFIWPILAIFLLSTLACQSIFTAIDSALDINPANAEQNSRVSAPAAFNTLTPTSQLAIFEELWKIVDRDYLYDDFNGLDWKDVNTQYGAKIESGISDEDFYRSMAEMVQRLGDDHSVYLNPQEAAQEDAQYYGENDFVGFGVLLSAIPEKERAVILVTFDDSPASDANLKPRDSILAIDGQPVLNEEGFLNDSLLGPSGSTAILTVQSPGEDPRQVSINRRQVTGSLPVPYSIITTPDGKRVGYILLVSFTDSSIERKIAAILGIFHNNDVEGIIIDNRMNEGGADTVLRQVLSYFTEGTLGYFINRRGKFPLHINDPEYVLNSGELPMVVLVGPNTVSFGEIFSGILKDTQRAYLIGEKTDGNIEILWGYTFEDGSRAWIAHDTFRPVNHPEHDWEQTGIIPDLTIPVAWEEYSVKEDPAVQAALEYFDYR